MQRTLGLFAGAIVAVLLAGCGGATPITSATTAPATPFPPAVTDEYTIPTASAGAAGIVKGPDNGLWFTESATDRLGELATSATVADFPVPTAGAMPLSIVVGADNEFWFTESGLPKIGRYTYQTTSFTEVSLPNPAARPSGIVAASDGNLYVTDPGTNGIWQITVNGAATFFGPLPTANANPTVIVQGPDSAMWFIETNANKIGRMTTSGTITEYAVPTAGAGLAGIASGTDNALWFTEANSDKIGRIVTTGVVSNEYSLAPVVTPGAIVQGLDGNFYIADVSSTGNAIAQFVPSTQKVTAFSIPTKPAGVASMTLGPETSQGYVYFTEATGNKIGRLRYF